MPRYPFLRRLLDLPVALAAVAALAIVWWLRAIRAEPGRGRTERGRGVGAR